MIRRIARPLLGSIFVYNGYTALTRDPGDTAAAAAPLVEHAKAALPDSAPVPGDPRTWVRANAAVQLGGGVLLATGRFPRAASLALAGSLIPTTVVEHAFWNETDPARQRDKQVQFVKNLSLLGGLLIAGVDTEGRPGLAWRTRRAAEHASARLSDTVESLTPGGDHDRGSAWRERAQGITGAAQGLAARATDTVSTAGEQAGKRLTDTAERVGPALTEAAHRAEHALTDAAHRVTPVLTEAAATTAGALSGALTAAGERVRGLAHDAGEAARGVAEQAGAAKSGAAR